MTHSPLAAKTSSLHLLNLFGVPIFRQLQIEEALLRADQRNWCLINTGSPSAIVMGISGKPETCLNLNMLGADPVPLIKRFSGGGTVFIDPHTFFITWICNSACANAPCCPDKIHRWAEHFYQSMFPDLSMQLRENDYVLGERKFGGNAQYLCKERWLHHTSLLWDYQDNNMRYLQMPLKVPAYRQGRAHADFLCRLRDYFPSKEQLHLRCLETLKREFQVIEVELEEITDVLQKEHRKGVSIIHCLKGDPFQAVQ